MLFFYVRHGDPIYHPDSLTPKGELQAAALAPRLARYGLDQIYVSSSNRAQLTAKPTCQALNLQPTVLDWCNESHAYRELSVTDENGKRHWLFQDNYYCRLMISPEIRALDHKWYLHKAFSKGTFQQGFQRIQREADQFMEQLGYRRRPQDGVYDTVHPNDQRVALFAHQGFGLAFLSHLLNIPYPAFCSYFDMGHTGVTVIEFKDLDGISIPKVLQLSNDSHLYHEGLPTDYQNRVWI